MTAILKYHFLFCRVMAASVTETALDLSAKSASSTPVLSPKAMTSPVPSVISDDLIDEPDRSPSASSAISCSSSERSSPRPSLSPSSAIKPILGPLPPISLQPRPPTIKEEEPAAPATSRGNSMRPFKMYPFEPMSTMYSQLATQTAAAAATAGLYPLGALPCASSAAAPPTLPMNLFDNSALMLSSPITQYLQQRKRRHDGRGSSGSTSSVESVGPLPGLPDGSASPDAAKKGRLSDTDEKRDEAYWERRRKNNEAAKRSRDARRAKEEEIALRAAFLEQENLKLRAQVAILKNETAKLHYMLYNRL